MCATSNSLHPAIQQTRAKLITTTKEVIPNNTAYGPEYSDRGRHFALVNCREFMVLLEL